MRTPKKAIRGLQNIRTVSGRVDQEFSPHKIYMKISCLEMEKFRRGQEREAAKHRVENIDLRFKEIEGEKAALLGALNEGICANPVQASGTKKEARCSR